MCNKRIHVNRIAGLAQRAHAIVIDINFVFLLLFVQKGYLFLIYLFIKKAGELKQFTNKLRRLLHRVIVLCVINLVCPFCPLRCNFIINLHLIYDEIENTRTQCAPATATQQHQRRLKALACHAICSVQH